MEPRGFMTALFDYSFTSFVTPKIIKILYLLATVVVALSTLVLVLAAFNNSSGAGILTLVIVGPLFFLISMIYARVLLELVIVFFRINGNVQELRDGRSGGPVQPAPTPAPPAVDTAVVAPAETAITIEQAAETPPTAVSSPEPEPEASARFCENCGAERRPEAALLHELRARVTRVPPLMCATCGSEEPEGSRFCGNCGTPFVAADPQPAAAAVEPGTTRRRHLVAAGAVALLVAGAAAAAVLALTGDGDPTEASAGDSVATEGQPPLTTGSDALPSSSSPTLVDSVTPQFVELVGYQGALSARVRSLQAGVESFAALRQAADALAASAVGTEDSLDGFAPATGQESDTLVLLHQALVAHVAYTDVLSSFPALPRSFTRAEAQAAIDRALEVQTAYTALAAAEPTLSGISLNSADHIRLLELVPAPAATPPAETSELTAFVAHVESVLVESEAGRRELGSAIAAGFNCSISTTAAANRVERVVENRQRLLGLLGGLQTPTQQAGAAAGLLQAALQHSIEADVHYRDGFLAADRGNARCRRMRASRSPTSRTCSPSAAKQRFVAVYNPLARSVGRRTWSAGEV